MPNLLEVAAFIFVVSCIVAGFTIEVSSFWIALAGLVLWALAKWVEYRG